MKMVKIQDGTHKDLTKLLGELTAKNGEIKTYDDVIKALIKRYREP